MLMRGGQECSEWLARCQIRQKESSSHRREDGGNVRARTGRVMAGVDWYVVVEWSLYKGLQLKPEINDTTHSSCFGLSNNFLNVSLFVALNYSHWV